MTTTCFSRLESNRWRNRLQGSESISCHGFGHFVTGAINGGFCSLYTQYQQGRVRASRGFCYEVYGLIPPVAYCEINHFAALGYI